MIGTTVHGTIQLQFLVLTVLKSLSSRGNTTLYESFVYRLRCSIYLKRFKWSARIFGSFFTLILKVDKKHFIKSSFIVSLRISPIRILYCTVQSTVKRLTNLFWASCLLLQVSQKYLCSLQRVSVSENPLGKRTLC